MPEEKDPKKQEGLGEQELVTPETEPISVETEEDVIPDKEKARRQEKLQEMAQEARDEEDDEGMIEQKKSVKELIDTAKSKSFDRPGNKMIVETLGAKIMDPKEKIGLRKTLEQVLSDDAALFDDLKDWCVGNYDALIEAGEIIEPK